MTSFSSDIFSLARQNNFFRREILTNQHSQVVIMSLKPGEDIGEEVHDVDQILLFVEGNGEAILNGKHSSVTVHSLVVVPAGTRHNFINTGVSTLKLFTIYTPPEETPGTIHKTKAEALAAQGTART